MINISKRELVHAQLALATAVLLQVFALYLNHTLPLGPQYFIIATEIGMIVLIGTTLNIHESTSRVIQKYTAGGLLGFISFANIISMVTVLHSLIVQHVTISGEELLASAVAIFLTNIIVYALWYWEIDSPGLTSERWSRHDKDFQFPQQDMPKEFPKWKPEFVDYLYLSITNAINFATADAKPLTRSAKMLMASQALVSVFTLALIVARSVTVLG